jgi:WD40 repeat protein
MQSWKEARRSLLLDVLTIGGVCEFALDYAYELQGCCVYTIDQSDISWKVVLLHGNRIATASHDTSILVSDFTSGKHLLTLKSHTSSVFDLTAWDERLVSVSNDGTARVWELEQGSCLLTLQHPAAVNAASVFESKLATACSDGLLRVWDGDRCVATFAHVDGLLGLWDGVSAHSRMIPLDLAVLDDQTFVVGLPLETIVFCPKTGWHASFDKPDCTRAATIVALADGTLVTYTLHCIHVWTHTLARSIPCVEIVSLCGLYDGRIAVSCCDMKIRIYDVFTGLCTLIDIALAGGGGSLVQGEKVSNLVALPDGRLAGSADTRTASVGGGVVLVWDVQTGGCVAWIEHAFTITDLVVVGHRLVVTSDSPCDECECEIVSDCDNCGKLCVFE